MEDMDNDADFSFDVKLPSTEWQYSMSHFWMSKWHSGIQPVFQHHATANTHTELVFAFAREQGQRGTPVFSTVQGHTGNFRSIESGGLSEMFGVSLHSHALRGLFGISPSDMRNQLIDLSELIGREGSEWMDQLARTPDFNVRVGMVTRFLERRVKTRIKTDSAMAVAIRKIKVNKGQVDITALAKEMALSPRQFQRRFKEFTGFNPKLYARIARFECALSPDPDWTKLTERALTLGYYDQAHFINDFKQFSGFSPGRYAPITT